MDPVVVAAVAAAWESETMADCLSGCFPRSLFLGVGRGRRGGRSRRVSGAVGYVLVFGLGRVGYHTRSFCFAVCP